MNKIGIAGSFIKYFCTKEDCRWGDKKSPMTCKPILAVLGAQQALQHFYNISLIVRECSLRSAPLQAWSGYGK